MIVAIQAGLEMATVMMKITTLAVILMVVTVVAQMLILNGAQNAIVSNKCY